MGFMQSMDVHVAPLATHINHRAARHAALASNIANVDTPGYRAVDVRFADTLDRAKLRMSATNGMHLQGSRSKFSDGFERYEIAGEARRDGNNVNIDNEMVKLAENQIEFTFLSRMLGGKFKKLKEAITGRSA
jgi:flagellar basal-body rod protein FlgB